MGFVHAHSMPIEPGSYIFYSKHKKGMEPSEWRSQNDFRNDNKLKLKRIPTLLLYGTHQRLEEKQLAKQPLVNLFFEDEL